MVRIAKLTGMSNAYSVDVLGIIPTVEVTIFHASSHSRFSMSIKMRCNSTMAKVG